MKTQIRNRIRNGINATKKIAVGNTAKKLVVGALIAGSLGGAYSTLNWAANRDYDRWRGSKENAVEYRDGNPSENLVWTEYFVYDKDKDGNPDSVRTAVRANHPLRPFYGSSMRGIGYSEDSKEFGHVMADIENGFVTEVDETMGGKKIK